MKFKIGILGSCVTRDVFDNFFNKDIDLRYTISLYNSKSSIISIESSPVKMDNVVITNSQPNFVNTVIKNDFDKNFFDRLDQKSNELDYFIIDFIDERYDCIEIENGSLITRSDYLLSSGLLNGSNQYKQFYRVKRETIDLWKISFDSFIVKLLKIIPEDKIILHKAFYLEKYIDKNNKVQLFDGTFNKYFNQEEVSKHNNLLRIYYDYCESKLPNIKIIDLNQNIVSDYSHRWGLAPFHYEKKYYTTFIDELEKYIN